MGQRNAISQPKKCSVCTTTLGLHCTPAQEVYPTHTCLLLLLPESARARRSASKVKTNQQRGFSFRPTFLEKFFLFPRDMADKETVKVRGVSEKSKKFFQSVKAKENVKKNH